MDQDHNERERQAHNVEVILAHRVETFRAGREPQPVAFINGKVRIRRAKPSRNHTPVIGRG
jgi:hypothetical protein